LTCPNFSETADILNVGNSSRSVILGYHVGMINNWKEVLRDQMHTLFQCGLGLVADRMFISYSNNITSEVELRDLEAILNQYTFTRNATILYSANQPIEGVAINSLHEECTNRQRQRIDLKVNTSGDTVAFYFHTKGSSHFHSDWKTKLNEPWKYSNVLYWRKYMEYFTIERPHICMKKIFDEGKVGCGVHLLDFYAGNFWATSCRYLSSLEPLTFYPIHDGARRYTAEAYLTLGLKDRKKFASLSEPHLDLYNNMILPENFSDYSLRWVSK